LFILVAYNIDKYLDKLDTIIDLLKKIVKVVAQELDNVSSEIIKSNKQQNNKSNTNPDTK
jgi:hypothetical protein